MNYNKEAKSLTFRRGSEGSQVKVPIYGCTDGPRVADVESKVGYTVLVDGC